MSIYEQIISYDANRQGGYDSFSAPLSTSPGTREMHDISIIAEWLESLPKEDIGSISDSDDEFSLVPIERTSAKERLCNGIERTSTNQESSDSDFPTPTCKK